MDQTFDSGANSIAPTGKSRRMDDDELLQILAQHEREAMGSSTAQGITVYPGSGSQMNSNGTMTTLEIDNYNAWNAYMARPMGNEQQDRSQVVVPLIRDVLDWIMPQLIRMFCGTDRICMFDPEGPEDEDLAEQQTDACNYIFMRQNDGFNVIHDYLFEALLLRNGYIKVDWVTKRQVKIERYTGFTEDDVTKLVQDAEEDGDEIEIIGKDESMQTVFVPAPPPQPQPGQPPAPPGPPQLMPQQIPVYALKIRRITKKSCIEVSGVPRENVYVSPLTHNGLDESPYYCHKENKARSELLESGFDESIVDSAQPGPPQWLNLDELARNQVVDQLTIDTNDQDPSMQKIETRDCCVRVDYDGDGVAELRRVVVLGDEIALNEEIDEGNMASGVAFRTPHRHLGGSLYEKLIDLQQIKTDLLRQGLDNTWLVNNSGMAVDQDNVNLDDLMTRRPGNVVRTRGSPMDKFKELATPPVLGDIMQAIEYVDSQQQWRTGVGEDTTTLNPDELQDVTKGASMALLSKSELKVEQIARLLSEGLKDAFRKINNLIIRHQDKKMILQLRGKWVPIDPSQWKMRTSVSINVGLGSGNRDETRANLMQLGQLMQLGKQAGMVSPDNGYNFLKKSCETLGFSAPDEFFTDPQTPQGQQLQKAMQQPPLPLQIAQLKTQADQQKNQGQLQLAQFKAQAEMQQQKDEAQRNLTQIQAQAQSDNQQTVMDAQMKAREQVSDAMLKYIEIIVSAALKAQATSQAIQSDVQAARQSFPQ